MHKKFSLSRLQFYFLLIISLLFGLTSCQKEISLNLDAVPVPPTTTGWTTATVNAATHPARLLLKTLKPAPRTFTCNSVTGGIISSATIQVVVPAGAFLKLDNTPVTGDVILTTIPAQTYGEMVFHGLGTITGSEMIETGGMVYIKATQGTDVLKLKPGKTIGVFFPNSLGGGFRGYIGSESATDVANPVTWALNNNWVADSSGTAGQLGTLIRIDSLTWINCDRLLNLPGPFTSVKLKLPEAYGNTNTVCYMVFTSRRSIAGMYGDPVNKLFWQGANYKIPIGLPVKLVAISKINDKIYYGSAATTVTDNLLVTISQMDQITDGELTNRLNAL